MNARRILFVVALAMVAPTPAALAAQDTSLVVVEKDRIEISMIPPKLRVRQTRGSLVGFYSWRIDLKTSDGGSIVITSDTVMRTDNIRDVVRGSTLRRCGDERDFSSLRCTTVMGDSVSVRDDVLRIVVRDSAIVARVRKDRPPTMWGSVFEPNGRFRVDRLSVEYDDEDEASGTAPAPGLFALQPATACLLRPSNFTGVVIRAVYLMPRQPTRVQPMEALSTD